VFLSLASARPGRLRAAGGNAIQVAYAYSSNQEELLLPLIHRFNDERHALFDSLIAPGRREPEPGLAASGARGVRAPLGNTSAKRLERRPQL
jgi:hypothetical protein